MSVRDSQGKLVTAFKDSRPSSRGGIRIEDYPDTIPCRQKTEGLINLSRLVNLSKPGEYALTFHIKLHYILFDGWRDYLGDEGYDRLRHEPLVYDAEIKLPFSLTEPNQAELLRLALSLRDKIINAPNAWAAEQLADELFTLPEAVAYPQGRHLVAQGAFAPAVARALARTHNKSAVDLLVLLGKLPKPVSAQFGEWDIAGLLRELRGVAEPELRQYIDDALAKNEKRFPTRRSCHRLRTERRLPVAPFRLDPTGLLRYTEADGLENYAC